MGLRAEVELNDTSRSQRSFYQLSINLHFSLYDFGTANDSLSSRPAERDAI